MINPVQTDGRGMDPEGLKADFGREVRFSGGGCGTRHVLPEGTPQNIVAMHEAVETWAAEHDAGECHGAGRQRCASA